MNISQPAVLFIVGLLLVLLTYGVLHVVGIVLLVVGLLGILGIGFSDYRGRRTL